MKTLHGTVNPAGYGAASENLRPVMHLIKLRTGMPNLIDGTLNIQISEIYLVRPTALILPREYPLNLTSHLNETIKLQRCVIRGHKGIIMRPDTHERGYAHGPKHFEIMGAVKFRDELGLKDESAVDVEVEGDDAWWAAAI